MLRSPWLLLLSMLVLATASAARAAEPPDTVSGEAASPVDKLLPPRPHIQNYKDKDQFIADILAWKRKRAELEKEYREGKLKLPSPPPKAPRTSWHDITGPENLDQALRYAEGYEQPFYSQRFRYHRTTHLSIPLERLSPGAMAKQSIGDGLLEKPPRRQDTPVVTDQGTDSNSQLQDQTAQLQAQLPQLQFTLNGQTDVNTRAR